MADFVEEPLKLPVLRVARPTDNLEPLLLFYRDGLGFDILSEFSDHEGFDGLMLGQKGSPYHFEFTHHRGHAVGKSPTQDHLLVFYFLVEADWQQAVDRMVEQGFMPVKSYNPYWNQNGKTFEDPDGYRVVLQQTA